MEEDIIMAPNLVFYQLLLVALVLIFLMLHIWWPDHSRATPHRPFKLDKPRRQRSKEPQPFPGLLHKPLCEACAQGAAARRRRPARHLPWSRAPEVADGLSIRAHTSVRLRIVPTMAGSAVATSALMGIPAVSPGVSCSVSPVTGISLRPTARFLVVFQKWR